MPKSGLSMIEFLNGTDTQGSICDLGTGESGILAYYTKARGACKVVALDKDPIAIANAKTASPIGCGIFWIVGDTFSPINKSCKFDLILSNPPQMPMKETGPLHDYGGCDGRDIIIKIMRETPNYLNDQGRAFLLCFDFLGVEKNYNTSPTIQQIATKYNLDCAVRASYTRTIRKGGKTEENLAWINTVYPAYQFKKDSQGNLFHEMLIVELRHLI